MAVRALYEFYEVGRRFFLIRLAGGVEQLPQRVPSFPLLLLRLLSLLALSAFALLHLLPDTFSLRRILLRIELENLVNCLHSGQASSSLSGWKVIA